MSATSGLCPTCRARVNLAHGFGVCGSCFTVCELAEPAPLSAPAARQHAATLAAGLRAFAGTPTATIQRAPIAVRLGNVLWDARESGSGSNEDAAQALKDYVVELVQAARDVRASEASTLHAALESVRAVLSNAFGIAAINMKLGLVQAGLESKELVACQRWAVAALVKYLKTSRHAAEHAVAWRISLGDAYAGPLKATLEWFHAERVFSAFFCGAAQADVLRDPTTRDLLTELCAPLPAALDLPHGGMFATPEDVAALAASLQSAGDPVVAAALHALLGGAAGSTRWASVDSTPPILARLLDAVASMAASPGRFSDAAATLAAAMSSSRGEASRMAAAGLSARPHHDAALAEAALDLLAHRFAPTLGLVPPVTGASAAASSAELGPPHAGTGDELPPPAAPGTVSAVLLPQWGYPGDKTSATQAALSTVEDCLLGLLASPTAGSAADGPGVDRSAWAVSECLRRITAISSARERLVVSGRLHDIIRRHGTAQLSRLTSMDAPVDAPSASIPPPPPPVPLRLWRSTSSDAGASGAFPAPVVSDVAALALLSVLHPETDSVPRLLNLVWRVVQREVGHEKERGMGDVTSPRLAGLAPQMVLRHCIAEAECYARHAPPGDFRAAGLVKRFDAVVKLLHAIVDASATIVAALPPLVSAEDLHALWSAVNGHASSSLADACTAAAAAVGAEAGPISMCIGGESAVVAPACIVEFAAQRQQQRGLLPGRHDLREAWAAFVCQLLGPVRTLSASSRLLADRDAAQLWASLFAEVPGDGAGVLAEAPVPQLPRVSFPGVPSRSATREAEGVAVLGPPFDAPELWLCHPPAPSAALAARVALDSLRASRACADVRARLAGQPAAMGPALFDAFAALWVLRNCGGTQPALERVDPLPIQALPIQASPCDTVVRFRVGSPLSADADPSSCVEGLSALLEIALGGCSAVSPRAAELLVHTYVASQRALLVQWARSYNPPESSTPAPKFPSHSLARILMARLRQRFADSASDPGRSATEVARCVAILRLYFHRLKLAIADVSSVSVTASLSSDVPDDDILESCALIQSHRAQCSDEGSRSPRMAVAMRKLHLLRTPFLSPALGDNVPALSLGKGAAVRELSLPPQRALRTDSGPHAAFAPAAESVSSPRSASCVVNGVVRSPVDVAFFRDCENWQRMSDVALSDMWATLDVGDDEYPLLFALLEANWGAGEVPRQLQQFTWGLLLDLPTSPARRLALEHPAAVDWELCLGCDPEQRRPGSASSPWNALYNLQVVIARLSESGAWGASFWSSGGPAAVVQLVSRAAPAAGFSSEQTPLATSEHELSRDLLAVALHVLAKRPAVSWAPILSRGHDARLFITSLCCAVGLSAMQQQDADGERAVDILASVVLPRVGVAHLDTDDWAAALSSEFAVRALGFALIHTGSGRLGAHLVDALLVPLIAAPSAAPIVLSMVCSSLRSVVSGVSTTTYEPLKKAALCLASSKSGDAESWNASVDLVAALLHCMMAWWCPSESNIPAFDTPSSCMHGTAAVLSISDEAATQGRPGIITILTLLGELVLPLGRSPDALDAPVACDISGSPPIKRPLWDATLEVVLSCGLFGTPQQTQFICRGNSERSAAFSTLRALLRALSSSCRGNHTLARDAALRRVVAVQCRSDTSADLAAPISADDAESVSAVTRATGDRVGLTHRSECGVVGLYNETNTCYAASVLQVWSSIPALHAAVLREPSSTVAGLPVRAGESAHLIHELQRVFLWLRHGHLRAYSPASFIDACAALRNMYHPPAHPRLQSDAMEFSAYLLDALEEQAGSDAAAAATESASEQAGGAASATTSSAALSDVAEPAGLVQPAATGAASATATKAALRRSLDRGAMIADTRCLHCGHLASQTPEDFVAVELGIVAGATAAPSIFSLLRARLRSENRPLDCTPCQLKRSHRYRQRFAVLPPVLVLQLKRFTLNSGKLHVRVSLEDSIDMREFLTAPAGVAPSAEDGGSTTYDLAGVIAHLGGETITMGHYVAYVPARDSRGHRIRGEWVCADDNRVTRVTAAEFEAATFGGSSTGSSAYVLFYERRVVATKPTDAGDACVARSGSDLRDSSKSDSDHADTHATIQSANRYLRSLAMSCDPSLRAFIAAVADDDLRAALTSAEALQEYGGAIADILPGWATPYAAAATGGVASGAAVAATSQHGVLTRVQPPVGSLLTALQGVGDAAEVALERRVNELVRALPPSGVVPYGVGPATSLLADGNGPYLQAPPALEKRRTTESFRSLAAVFLRAVADGVGQVLEGDAGPASSVIALAQRLVVLMHVQPSSARWLLRQMCTPSVASASAATWLSRCLLPSQAHGVSDRAVAAVVDQNCLALVAVIEAAVQIISLRDSAGVALFPAPDSTAMTPPLPFVDSAEALTVLFRTPLDYDLMALYKADAARMAFAAATVPNRDEIAGAAASLRPLLVSAASLRAASSLASSRDAAAETASADAELAFAMAMSEGVDGAAEEAGVLAAAAADAASALATASRDATSACATADAALAAEESRRGSTAVSALIAARLSSSAADANADHLSATDHALVSPGPASELTAFLVALAGVIRESGRRAAPALTRMRLLALARSVSSAQNARAAPLSTLWRWWPYTWLPAAMRALPRERLELAWRCPDAPAARSVDFKIAPAASGTHASSPPSLFALAESRQELLGAAPVALGVGLVEAILSSVRASDNLGQAPLDAAGAVAGTAPHLFLGIMGEAAVALSASPDALQCGTALADAALAGALSSSLRDQVCGRAVAVLSRCGADAGLRRVDMVSLCPWVPGDVGGAAAAATADLEAALGVPAMAEAARAGPGLTASASSPVVCEWVSFSRAVPADAVAAVPASSWIPHAIARGAMPSAAGVRTLLTMLSRLPPALASAVAHTAILGVPVVAAVAPESPGSGSVVDVRPLSDGATPPLPWGPLVTAALGGGGGGGELAARQTAAAIAALRSLGQAHGSPFLPWLLPLLERVPGGGGDVAASARLMAAVDSRPRAVPPGTLTLGPPAAPDAHGDPLLAAIVGPVRSAIQRECSVSSLRGVMQASLDMRLARYGAFRTRPTAELLGGLTPPRLDDDLALCLLLERVLEDRAESFCEGGGVALLIAVMRAHSACLTTLDDEVLVRSGEILMAVADSDLGRQAGPLSLSSAENMSALCSVAAPLLRLGPSRPLLALLSTLARLADADPSRAAIISCGAVNVALAALDKLASPFTLLAGGGGGRISLECKASVLRLITLVADCAAGRAALISQSACASVLESTVGERDPSAATAGIYAIAACCYGAPGSHALVMRQHLGRVLAEFLRDRRHPQFHQPTAVLLWALAGQGEAHAAKLRADGCLAAVRECAKAATTARGSSAAPPLPELLAALRGAYAALAGPGARSLDDELSGAPAPPSLPVAGSAAAAAAAPLFSVEDESVVDDRPEVVVSMQTYLKYMLGDPAAVAEVQRLSQDALVSARKASTAPAHPAVAAAPLPLPAQAALPAPVAVAPPPPPPPPPSGPTTAALLQAVTQCDSGAGLVAALGALLLRTGAPRPRTPAGFAEPTRPLPPPHGGPLDATPSSAAGTLVLSIAAAIQRIAAAPATATEAAAPLALCYALDALKLSCEPDALAAAAALVVPAAFATLQLCPADAIVAVAALDVLATVYERKKSAAAGQVLERADALHFLEGVPALVAALAAHPAVAEEACLILADLAAVSPRAKERLTGTPGGIAALLRTAARAGALQADAPPSNLVLEELAHAAERAAYNALIALGWAADVGPDVQRAITDAGGAAVIARTLRPRGRRQVERNQQAAALTLLLKLYPLCLAEPPVRLSLVDAGVAMALRALADDPASPVPPATAVQGCALLASGLVPADFEARVAQEAAARPAAATACAAALAETATDSQRKGLELLRKMCEGAKDPSRRFVRAGIPAFERLASVPGVDAFLLATGWVLRPAGAAGVEPGWVFEPHQPAWRLEAAVAVLDFARREAEEELAARGRPAPATAGTAAQLPEGSTGRPV